MILTLAGRVKLKFEGCDTVNKSLLPRRMRDDRPIFICAQQLRTFNNAQSCVRTNATPRARGDNPSAGVWYKGSEAEPGLQLVLLVPLSFSTPHTRG